MTKLKKSALVATAVIALIGFASGGKVLYERHVDRTRYKAMAICEYDRIKLLAKQEDPAEFMRTCMRAQGFQPNINILEKLCTSDALTSINDTVGIALYEDVRKHPLYSKHWVKCYDKRTLSIDFYVKF